jgi:hypothetical protein
VPLFGRKLVTKAELRAARSGRWVPGRVAEEHARPAESPFKKAKREAGKQPRRGRG